MRTICTRFFVEIHRKSSSIQEPVLELVPESTDDQLGANFDLVSLLSPVAHGAEHHSK